MPELYTIFVRKIDKIPEFHIIFAGKIFSRILGGHMPFLPPSPTLVSRIFI